MGMASLVGGINAAKRDFAKLRELRDRLAANTPPGTFHLPSSRWA